METDSRLHIVAFTLGVDLAPEVEPFLATCCPHGWQEAGADSPERKTVVVYLESPVAADHMLSSLLARWPSIQPVTGAMQNQEWASAWKRFFTPIHIADRFVIHPPWAGEDAGGAESIVINPQMAFGTGHHATTSLCLEAVVGLVKKNTVRPGQRFLDVGTGSGILGLVCAKLGLSGVGFDLDPLTLENIRENKELNAVDHGFDAFVGPIDVLRPGVCFDLVVANILARPLIFLAPEIARRINPGGVLILSGLLDSQVDRVARAYVDQGLPTPQAMLAGEWGCLVFS
ncbi:50S ribosomal protein L11 methyltransferase [Desulfoplanes sp.]